MKMANVNDDSQAQGSKKRKRKGDKTPTQLRNARKRRAKQKKKLKDPSQQYLANPKAAPIVQKAKTYMHSHGTNFPITVGPLQGWRTVAKLAARMCDGQLTLGLFAPNSHRLIPVPACVAHHASINKATVLLESVCRQVGVQAFDEASGQGLLRFVALNVERSTGKVQVTLVWNSTPYSESQSSKDEGKALLDAVCKAIISRAGASSAGRKRRRGRKEKQEGQSPNDKVELHSLWVHYNSSWKHSNAIFAIDSGTDSWEHCYGPIHMYEQLDIPDQKHRVPLFFPPNVFRQANLDGFTKIVARIRKRVQQYSRGQTAVELPSCVELYGGVGTIGLNVADLTSKLVCSDSNPFNVNCFQESVSHLPADVAQRVSYKSLNATDMMKNNSLQKADVVIVDPPRKGLDDTVLDSLCTEVTPKLLLYVSCGFDAFQRDCNSLLKHKWQLEHAEGHLLFPGSDAIETLAFFVAKER